MDAVEFFKTVNRLCKNQSGCEKCPIRKNGTCMVEFDDDSIKSIDETVSKVEQWAKDNPVKTRQSEFLKLFPDADISTGHVNVCPNSLYKEKCTCSKYPTCSACKHEFWLQEVE